MPTSRTWVRLSVSLLAGLLPFAVSVAARAAACGEQDCPKNWECKSESRPTDSIACAPGAECAIPEPATVEYCSPLPCSSDADCASDMVCYSGTQTECVDAPPCASGAECAAPADTGCTTVTVSACVPRYVLPCETASDCGTGFTCEEQEDCACGGSPGIGAGTPSSGSGSGPTPSDSGSSGSAGSSARPAAPPADGGAAEPVPADGAEAPADPDGKVPPDGGSELLPPDGQCTCTPSGVKACKLTVVGCTTTTDCPSGLTCEENPSGTCWAKSDGTSGCDTPDPARICAPPYTDLVSGAGRADDSGGENGGSTTGTGAPEPPKSGGPPDGSGVPASVTSEPAADGSHDVVTHAGCSLAGARDANARGYGLVALGLAGLFGARRRRR